MSKPAIEARPPQTFEEFQASARVGFDVYLWEVAGALLAVVVALPITLALHLSAV